MRSPLQPPETAIRSSGATSPKFRPSRVNLRHSPHRSSALAKSQEPTFSPEPLPLNQCTKTRTYWVKYAGIVDGRIGILTRKEEVVPYLPGCETQAPRSLSIPTKSPAAAVQPPPKGNHEHDRNSRNLGRRLPMARGSVLFQPREPPPMEGLSYSVTEPRRKTIRLPVGKKAKHTEPIHNREEDERLWNGKRPTLIGVLLGPIPPPDHPRVQKQTVHKRVPRIPAAKEATCNRSMYSEAPAGPLRELKKIVDLPPVPRTEAQWHQLTSEKEYTGSGLPETVTGVPQPERYDARLVTSYAHPHKLPSVRSRQQDGRKELDLTFAQFPRRMVRYGVSGSKRVHAVSKLVFSNKRVAELVERARKHNKQRRNEDPEKDFVRVRKWELFQRKVNELRKRGRTTFHQLEVPYGFAPAEGQRHSKAIRHYIAHAMASSGAETVLAAGRGKIRAGRLPGIGRDARSNTEMTAPEHEGTSESEDSELLRELNLSIYTGNGGGGEEEEEEGLLPQRRNEGGPPL